MCYKYIKIELKTSLSVSSKKDNSRCMTSSATSLFGLVIIKEELSYKCAFHWPFLFSGEEPFVQFTRGFYGKHLSENILNSSQLFKRR